MRRGDGVKAATGEIKSVAAMADVREIVDFIVYYRSSSRLQIKDKGRAIANFF